MMIRRNCRKENFKKRIVFPGRLGTNMGEPQKRRRFLTEFSDLGGWDSTHDVVRNATANAYLRKNVARALAAPGVAGKVRRASVYWLGGSQRCKGDAKQAPCSESQVAAYNTGLASTISAAGAEFLMHVDGPFFNLNPRQ